jgi:methionyl-tRNA formyltransferase
MTEKLGLRILEPENPNTDDFFQTLNKEQVDICVLTAYGFMIKPQLLQIPVKGFVNIHPSLLPKYRGAAPIQRTIINGERQTGVTTFFMNEAMDAGDIILQSKTDIGENETYDELRMRLAQIGADLLIETLSLIKNDNIQTVPQETTQVTIAKKIKKEHCIINWNQDAVNIHNLIRGLSSEPGAYAYFRGKRVKIIKSSVNIQPAMSISNPGQIMVMKKDLVVATQNGYLNIMLLQFEGGKAITGTDFINGQRLQPEEYFK